MTTNRKTKGNADPARRSGPTRSKTADETEPASGEVYFGMTAEEVDHEWDEIKLTPIVTLLLTVGPVTIAVARLIVFANGNLQTMLTLLETLNVSSIVTTTLLSFFVLPSVFMLIVLAILKPETSWERNMIGGAIGIINVAIFPVLKVQWWALGLVLVADLVGLTGGRRLRATILQSPVTLALIVIMSILPASGFEVTAWLPTQTITLADKHAETVYVLSDDNAGLTVMNANSREIAFISYNAILEREFCQQPGVADWYVIRMRVSTALPRCPGI